MAATLSRHARHLVVALYCGAAAVPAAAATTPVHPILLHAARLIELTTGRVIAPAEVLVEGERISAVGPSVPHPAGTEVLDLGDRT